jgi:hypothetical protein
LGTSLGTLYYLPRYTTTILIYREQNKIADELSKEELHLSELYGSLEEVQDGQTVILQQFSFNDF